jgi:hypothetical protein
VEGFADNGENLGNCFVYDHFTSLHVSGDGTYGTNCIAYSDTNCQTEMTVSPLPFFLKIRKRQWSSNLLQWSGPSADAREGNRQHGRWQWQVHRSPERQEYEVLLPLLDAGARYLLPY